MTPRRTSFLRPAPGFPVWTQRRLLPLPSGASKRPFVRAKRLRPEVLVPVDFQLSDETTATGWAVVPDTEPMEFDSATEELAFLDGKTKDIQKEFLKAGYTIRETKGPKIWWVFDDPSAAWSMVARNGSAVLRVRQVETPAGREARYAYLCGGTPTWCKAKLDDYVSYIQANPLPPPPK